MGLFFLAPYGVGNGMDATNPVLYTNSPQCSTAPPNGGARGFKVEHLASVAPALYIVDKVVCYAFAVAGIIANRAEMVVIKVDLRHKDLNKRFAELRIRRISVAEPFEPERELVARQLRLLNLFILDRDFQIYAPRFEIVEPLLRAGRNNALLDGRDQVRDRALNFDELRLESAENAVVLLAFLKVERASTMTRMTSSFRMRP